VVYSNKQSMVAEEDLQNQGSTKEGDIILASFERTSSDMGQSPKEE